MNRDEPIVLQCGKSAQFAAFFVRIQEAEAEAAAEAATDVVIRLGLAAFAVSAYIKTVLCPSLSSYTPRMSSASLVRAPAGPLLSIPQNAGSNRRFPKSAAASSLPCKHHPAVDAMALVDRDLGSTRERHLRAAGLQSQRFQQGVRVLSLTTCQGLLFKRG